MTKPPATGPEPADWRPESGTANPAHRPGGRAGADPTQQWDEQVWRRPPREETHAHPTSTEPAYTGPPRGDPVDASWRPPIVIQVPPARQLPPQDDAAIDVQEHQARTVTYGIGMIAGAVALIVLFIVCGHALF